VNWKLFDGTDKDWAILLSKYKYSTHFQDVEWADSFSKLGWKTYRWICIDSNITVALIQGFYRVYPLSVGVLWLPDWVAGDFVAGLDFHVFLRKFFDQKFLYIRFRSHRAWSRIEHDALINAGWRLPDKKFDIGLTMTLDLRVNESDLEANLSDNWRRSYKRSFRAEYDIERITDPQKIIDLYSELSHIKGLDHLLSGCEIRNLMSAYGTKLLVLGAINRAGKVLAIRGAIIDGKNAWDTFAAAGLQARKIYASYALFMRLILECKNRGCENYDLNGVDPQNNTGVYNFKKGTGALIKQRLGEFEWTSLSILSKFVCSFGSSR